MNAPPTDNVVTLDTPWHRELDPDTMLEANKGKFDSGKVILVGVIGGDIALGASVADLAEVHWLLSCAIQKIMRGDFGEAF